jgi:O-antigen/teichoic acid export membrane protein
VGLLYDARYAAATGVLRVLFTANAIGSVSLLLVPVALRLGHARLVAIVGVAAFAVNLGGDLLWIPSHGALGSALATLCMHLTGIAILGVAITRDLRRRGADPLPAHIG